ncbi:MAG TPA: transglutaminase domain-containing protein [Longimicrobium sp.]|nr:transglutaminase domain-containing protein [Longimicrobium sp.]
MLRSFVRAALLLGALMLAAPLGAQAHDYARADSVARAVPARAAASVQTLAAHFRGALPGERDRARALYRWLVENVAYDVDQFYNPPLLGKVYDAGTVLRRRKGVCAEFAILFERLAVGAGLEAVTVTGQAKAFSPNPRRPFLTQMHNWNAVKVDGEWIALDASWGAGDVMGRDFVRRPREFYFDPDPAKLIWSHWPAEPRWQLLERPLSQREFDRLPFTPRDFWDLGFRADAVAEAARRPGFRAFVGAFPAPGQPVEVLEAPLAFHLAPGEAHPFRLRAPGATEVVAVSGTAWHKLEPEGDTFGGTAALEAKDLVVMVRYPARPEGVVVLRYEEAGARGRGR